MEGVFIIIIVVLMVLAVSNLVVGISNDAVNFLNGAIGSKAAMLRVILFVAAAGILMGVTFSDGMMGVARNGLFNPTAFSYKDVMVICLSVMLTNVILLDLFNTYGLPTSTTVSMVFGLLGAAVGIAILKIARSTGDYSELVNYLNSGKALVIISGILVSIVIAFIFGALIQWLSRLLFTFNFEKNIKYYGGLFGGFAITCILYFILIKGLKDSVYSYKVISCIPLGDWINFMSVQDFDGFKSLVITLQNYTSNSDLAAWGQTLATYNKETFAFGASEFSDWARSNSDLSLKIPLYLEQFINYYTWQILLFGFLATSIVFQFLNWLFKLNVLKVIVLIGTFALALSFAGNDLVNFIGLPLASLAAHQDFIANSGTNPDSFMMGALMRPVSTPTFFLLISGMVMVIALWISKKARTVIITELNLSNQDVVHERFESNAFAREIVRVFLRIGNFVSRLVPSYIKQKIAKRFDSNSFTNKESGVSFDLVRGAVILFVSSALIAFGTSNKLPLSTTYVTFMVAMGASMADGAWDRESAVYRVTGVISIIGAWFFTAFSAFIAALLIAVFIFKTWWIGIFIMIGLALFLLIKSHLLHKSLSSEDANLQHAISTNLNDSESFYESSSNTIVSILIATLKSFEETIEWIDQEKRKKLKDTLKNVEKLNNVTKKLKKRIPVLFKELNEDMLENGPYYAEIIDYTREAMHCLEHITAPAFKHVDNNHKPLTGLQIDSLKEISTDLTKYFNIIIKDITESDFRNAALAVSESQQLIEKISKIKKKQLKHLKKDPGSTRTNILYLDIVNESRNMILNINNMYKSFRNFSENANHSIRNSAL